MDFIEASRILHEDPDIDPNVFWPSVGISYEVVQQVAQVGANAFGIDVRCILASMEIGATLAKEGLKHGTQGEA